VALMLVIRQGQLNTCVCKNHLVLIDLDDRMFAGNELQTTKTYTELGQFSTMCWRVDDWWAPDDRSGLAGQADWSTSIKHASNMWIVPCMSAVTPCGKFVV